MRLTKFLLLLQWSTQRTELLSKGWILIINVAHNIFPVLCLPVGIVLPSSRRLSEDMWPELADDHLIIDPSEHPLHGFSITLGPQVTSWCREAPKGNHDSHEVGEKKLYFQLLTFWVCLFLQQTFNSIGDVDCYFWESLWFIFYFLLLFALIFFLLAFIPRTQVFEFSVSPGISSSSVRPPLLI